MEIFVTLVDGWRPQTNNTFILDTAITLDTSLWKNLGLIDDIENIENIKYFFLWSEY